ncbi:MAG: potassium transporter TrkG, partial [Pseudomonadota bacterium]
MILRLPIMVLIMGGMALLMLLPSIYGAILGEWRISRAFLHASIFVFFSAYAVTLIMTGRREPSPRRELSVLLLSWLLVPVFAAIPVSILSPALGPVGAWFDMVAAFTTTGGSAFGDPASVPNPVHLWRGLVAWMGGLVTLTAAFVILAPRRLGGFEVEPGGSTSYGSGGQIQQSVTLAAGTVPLDSRLYRALRVILPVYSGLTFCLALIFTSLGESGLDASVHAMSILSTSGISPNARGLAESDSFLVELTAALFMIFAASRLLYSGARQGGAFRRPDDDPELKLMLAMVALATLTLFSRHWIGALTIDLNEANLDAFDAFWGSVFTTLSFLTTTGFESSSWRTARDW